MASEVLRLREDYELDGCRAVPKSLFCRREVHRALRWFPNAAQMMTVINAPAGARLARLQFGNLGRSVRPGDQIGHELAEVLRLSRQYADGITMQATSRWRLDSSLI